MARGPWSVEHCSQQSSGLGCKLAAGGGQAQTLVLSYLIALGKLRKTINEQLKGSTLSISDFREQAFFMDSVSGQMEPEYQRAVAHVLPEHIKQLVVLVARQQWGEAVEKGLRGRLTDSYGLELSTPRKTPADHYQFMLGGRAVKLVRHLDAGKQAFTTIKELDSRLWLSFVSPSPPRSCCSL